MGLVKPRTAPPPPSVLGARWLSLSKDKFALVDDVDYETVARYRWYFLQAPTHKFGYAHARIGGRTVYLHHLIWRLMGKRKRQLDHKNRNSLDNRRENLRAATYAENSRNHGRQRNNTSGYKGVFRNHKLGKWQAKIHGPRKNGRVNQIHLGVFTLIEDAAKAYDKAAMEIYGEFAATNFSYAKAS